MARLLQDHPPLFKMSVGGGKVGQPILLPTLILANQCDLQNPKKCGHARLHAPAYMPCAPRVRVWAHETVRFMHAVAASGGGVRRRFFGAPADFDKSPRSC